MYWFKLNWGKYRVSSYGTVTQYKAGDVIKTKEELDKIFPLFYNGQFKFELVKQETPVKPSIPGGKRSPSESVEGGPEQPSSTAPIVEDEQEERTANVPVQTSSVHVSKDYGDDMTDEFPEVGQFNVKIFFNGKRYRIVNMTSGEVLNSEKLAKPKDVKEFLKQMPGM